MFGQAGTPTNQIVKTTCNDNSENVKYSKYILLYPHKNRSQKVETTYPMGFLN